MDGRTASARRYAALVAAFEAEVGGDLTEAERGLVAQAATLQLRVEQLTADVVAGRAVDDDLLIRLSSTARRALSKITARAKPAGATSLAEYLASRQAVADDVEDDD